jgi:hypothetical protein
MSRAEWKGPSTRDMISTHTLAAQIIANHNEPCPVLDSSALDLLQRFCADPSSKNAILRDRDMVDEPGDLPGHRAQSKYGSLVGYAIARHGTDSPVLEEREIDMLREWFESGGAEARHEGHDSYDSWMDGIECR